MTLVLTASFLPITHSSQKPNDTHEANIDPVSKASKHITAEYIRPQSPGSSLHLSLHLLQNLLSIHQRCRSTWLAPNLANRHRYTDAVTTGTLCPTRKVHGLTLALRISGTSNVNPQKKPSPSAPSTPAAPATHPISSTTSSSAASARCIKSTSRASGARGVTGRERDRCGGERN
ncbi:hypothetical protein BDR22DRAFT_852807 [Usnea florida]